ncbi:hypothetical protein RLIN73S_02147 [Rhodanobacter lindaniclasticus]
MVGRGTRIDEPTQKYKFWLYDYTGVTDLFGTEFITAPPRSGGGGGSGGGDDEGDDDDDYPSTPVPMMRLGDSNHVVITPQGRCMLVNRGGKATPIPWTNTAAR